MTWRIGITCHPVDRSTLRALFPTGGDLSFADEGDGSEAFLETTQLDGQDMKVIDVHAWAQETVERVNGLAALRDPQFEPVTLTGRFENPDEGSTHVHLTVDSSASARAGIAADGIVVSGNVHAAPPPRGPQPLDDVALAKNDGDVDEALGILGSP